MSGRMGAGCVVAVVVLALATGTASASMTLNYEGSLKLPTRSGSPKDYYAQAAGYVPVGTPVLGGGSVTMPTLLVGYIWGHNTVEYNQLPALAKTPAAIAAAPIAAQGTTRVQLTGGSRLFSDVDSAGNMWDADRYNSGGGTGGLLSDPGVHMVGATSLSANYKMQETGWPAAWGYSGCLRLGDNAGGSLPTNGTDVGARFLDCVGSNASGGSGVVYDVTRGATTMTSTLLFSLTGGFGCNVRYVRDTLGEEYILAWRYGVHTGDTYVLNFYDPATAVGGVVNPTPQYSLNIGPDIAGGAGWLSGASIIGGIAFDWATSQMYVMDYSGQQTRVHVFTLNNSIPLVPEPACLGLLFLGLPVVLRRRRR